MFYVQKHLNLINFKKPFMKKLILLFITSSTLILAESCCDCSNDEQKLSNSELSWIPDGKIGDSLVFQNDQGNTKTYYITSKKAFIKESECPPFFCCACKENDASQYSFQALEDTTMKTFKGLDGITIILNKSNNIFKKSFYINCTTEIQDFDYSLDTFKIDNKLHKNVLVKDSKNCKSKVYYTKGLGLIRFEDENETWNLSN